MLMSSIGGRAVFYFDVENLAHVAFATLAIILLASCAGLIFYNRVRAVPVVLPERHYVGPVVTILDEEVGPAPAINGQTEKRDLVEIFVLAPETAPYESMFRIFININNFEREETAAHKTGDWEALIASLQRGDAVGLILQCTQLLVDTPYQALQWERRNHVAVFNARSPRRANNVKVSDNKLLVVIGGYPIGEIDFKIRFDGESKTLLATRRQNARLTIDNVNSEIRNLPIAEKGFKATRFSSAFISYSRANTKEMALFCSGLDARGIDIKVDRFEFRTGENWDDQAKALIDKCDIVFLLWSAEASQSEAVRKEIDYSADRRRDTGRPSLHPVVVKQSDNLPAPPHIPSNMLWAGRFSAFLK